ncbi:hypothetical protein OIE71_16045 [Streptomyces sp. NBC_01725]|nr:hypothetical protein [Streptomyces sp. NBC_01725]
MRRAETEPVVDFARLFGQFDCAAGHAADHDKVDIDLTPPTSGTFRPAGSAANSREAGDPLDAGPLSQLGLRSV